MLYNHIYSLVWKLICFKHKFSKYIFRNSFFWKYETLININMFQVSEILRSMAKALMDTFYGVTNIAKTNMGLQDQSNWFFNPILIPEKNIFVWTSHWEQLFIWGSYRIWHVEWKQALLWTLLTKISRKMKPWNLPKKLKVISFSSLTAIMRTYWRNNEWFIQFQLENTETNVVNR